MELPRRDLAVEQDVQFGISPAFWLWKAKIAIRGAEEAETSPEETCLASPLDRGQPGHFSKVCFGCKGDKCLRSMRKD